ncbi:MAG: type 4a pilus biogenesis protein PilO [bacterium]
MNYLVTTILLAVSVLVYFGSINPLMTNISALSSTRDSLNNSLSESKNLRTILAQKEGLYNNFTDEERTKINKLLPDSIDNIKLVIDIDDVASRYQMKIRNIDLKTNNDTQNPQEASKDYGTATLRFSVSAPYDKFRSFLTDLENSLRIVDASSVSFTAGDKDINEYNVELKTYWLKETI